MYRIFLGFIMILSFQSCSLFVTDVTAGIKAVNAVEESGINTYDTMKALLEKAKMPDEVRAKILADVKKEEDKFTLLISELRKNIESYGSIDYNKLSQDLYNMYKKIREEKK